jgi:hypothetical protein
MYSIPISNKFLLNSSKDVFLLPTVGFVTTFTNLTVVNAVHTGGPYAVGPTNNIAARNNRGSQVFSDKVLETEVPDFNNGISLDHLIQLRLKYDSSI